MVLYLIHRFADSSVDGNGGTCNAVAVNVISNIYNYIDQPRFCLYITIYLKLKRFL